jgi:hypothetical protein
MKEMSMNIRVQPFLPSQELHPCMSSVPYMYMDMCAIQNFRCCFRITERVT